MASRAKCIHLVAVVGLGTLVLAGTVSACGGVDESGCPAPTSAPAGELRQLPDRLSLHEVGPVTDVRRSAGHIVIKAVTDLPIDDASFKVQDAVVAAGYRPSGLDNEGFEAEVFFVRGDYAAGQALLRAGACEGQWDVELTLVDPERIPAPSTSRRSNSATTT